MKIYRVQVRGYFKVDGHSTAVDTAILDFLIDADSADEAFTAGPGIAESVVQFGPKWTSFESIEASPISFPYMLRDSTSRT